MKQIPVGAKGHLPMMTLIFGLGAVAAAVSAINLYSQGNTAAFGVLVFGAILGWFAYTFRVKLRHSGPAVSMREEGIIFHLTSPTILPWHALRQIQVFHGRASHMRFRFDPDLIPEVVPGPPPRILPPTPWRKEGDFIVGSQDTDLRLSELRELAVPYWQDGLKRRYPTAVIGKAPSWIHDRFEATNRDGVPLTA